MNPRKLFFIAPVAIVGIAVFVTLGALIVKWLWNWLLPPLFGWHTLSFWQALGLLALTRILFGGFGLHGGPRSDVRRRVAVRWEQRMAGETRAEPGGGTVV